MFVDDVDVLPAERVADVEPVPWALIVPFRWMVATRMPSTTRPCGIGASGGGRDGFWGGGRPGRVGLRRRFPRGLRGDPAGQRLMRPLGVVDGVERVDLLLQLFEGRGEGLLVEPPEQGLMEALVLALRGRLVRLAGDRLDPEPVTCATSCPRCRAGTGSTRRRCPTAAAAGRRARGSLSSTTAIASFEVSPRDVGRDRVPGVVVDELEDHALASTGEDVLGGVQLPARVRRRIHEPAIRRPRLLPRLRPRDPGVAEDPRQRRQRRRGHPEGPHLLVHADRPVIQPRRLQRGPHPDRLLLHVVGEPGRTALGRRVRGSSAAAGPSSRARLRIA